MIYITILVLFLSSNPGLRLVISLFKGVRVEIDMITKGY